MTDWGTTLAALSLLLQMPDFHEKWERFVKMLLERTNLTKPELQESQIALFEGRLDLLLYKILLLDLILAFSNQHSMNDQLVKYCKEQRPRVFSEFKKIQNQLKQISSSEPGPNTN